MENKRALTFIFIALLLDFTGIGLIAPVMPQLIESVSGGTTSDAAVIGGWMGFAYAMMQFLIAPIMGALSDRYGRRPVLLLSLLGLGIDNLTLSWAPTLLWLFVGRAIAGAMGASFTAAYAYVADVTPPEKRAASFGMLGAAFGLGFMLGPAIGGLVADMGPRMPFVIAAGLSLANTVFGYFALPESLKVENRRKFEWGRANAIGTLKQIVKYKQLTPLLIALLIFYIAGQVMPSTWSYFTVERFEWEPKQIGFSLAFIGLLAGVVQGLLVGRIVKWLGQRGAILVGVMLYVGSLLALSFAAEPWQLYAFAVPYMFGGVAGPTLTALISTLIPVNQQGELQGATSALLSVASVISPVMMTTVFSFFTRGGPGNGHYFPGAAFVLAAALLVVGGVLIAVTLPGVKRGEVESTN